MPEPIAAAESLHEHALAAIPLLDLTSLDDADTAERIAALCRRAVSPAPGFPPVAAVCVFPRFAARARKELAGSPVRVACVAGGFPSGRAPLPERIAEVRRAIAEGAEEIDAPIDREAFRAGEEERVSADVAALRQACGAAALLKVILETGELGSDDRIRRAAAIAAAGGADFLKTSTGKSRVGATPRAALLLLEAARDAEIRTGRAVGVKVSGGIRRTAEALGYVSLAERVRGPSGTTAARFRIGASALLDDLVAAAAGGAGP